MFAALKTCMEAEKVVNEPLHPIFYEVYQPNSLVKAKGKEEFKVTEFRVYNEIISFNHKSEPNRLQYEIPINLVSKCKDFKSVVTEIKDSLQKRSLVLDKKMIEILNLDTTADIRSITPFPTIDFEDKKKHFIVHLHENFKKVLMMIERNYSKGDLETLRTLKHVASNLMYWEIRRRQVFKKTWSTSFDNMRDELGYVNKYVDNFPEFKRNVLDMAQKELTNTWCSFEYSLKKTTHGKVSDITIYFKRGPEEENNSPIGKDVQYHWEEKLLNLGVKDHQLKMIRQHIRSKSETLSKDGKKITWDYDYVNMSLDHARKQYSDQNKTKNKITNIGAWFLIGLMEGYWLDKVEQERIKIRNAVQTTLFG